MDKDPATTGQFVRIALINFFIAASLGLLLRYAFVWDVRWINYKNVMHAHSHVAMLGWIYPALFVYSWKTFGLSINPKIMIVLFWLTEFSVLGMIVSFPVQGYGVFSISFSVLHIITSYIFAYKLWQSLKGRRGPDITMMRTAIVWMLISTLGIWAMGPLVSTGSKGSPLYFMAIQFFLHFQFNGWYLFAALALFFNHVSEDVHAFKKKINAFYYVLVMSCFLTFALAVTWAEPDESLFVVNSFGVATQLIALALFVRLFLNRAGKQVLARLDRFTRVFYQIAFISFIAKVFIQFTVVIPDVAIISYTIRLLVLGFIHLITLGCITAFLLGYGFSKGLISTRTSISAAGWIITMTGFISSEVILFGQGTLLWAGLGYIPNYYIIIFLTSALLPLGILMGIAGQWYSMLRLPRLNY